MADNQEFPSALVSPHERLSIIWLLPIVALIFGGWLFYKSQTEANIPVLIHFSSGQGLIAGKTEVRYQGISIGVVRKFKLDADLDGVTADVAFDKSAERLLREGSQFWLVKPQVSLKGISGLDTLFSGAYISLRPGIGEYTDQFEALSEPPALGTDDPGLNIRLHATTLGSVQYGSPVHYRQLQVGDIQGYELDQQGQGVWIKINIQDQYAALVRSNSRFWNNSGISIKGGLSGLSLKTDSMTSLLVGGISFDTPESLTPTAAAEDNAVFELHENFETANVGILVRVAFDTAEGLEAGVTPVVFKGLKTGTLVKLGLDPQRNQVIAELKLSPDTEVLLSQGTRFWLQQPRIDASGISGLDLLLKGNQIQVEFRAGEPITGYDFSALPAPPRPGPEAPGLNLNLSASTLGSLQQGSPVYFRKLQVGAVQDYALSDDGQQVQIALNIRPEYASLVKRNSRFWNNSGVRFQAGLSGLSVQSDSLTSMLIGSINFDLDSDQKPGQEATNGDQFRLYSDYEEAQVGVQVRVIFPSAEGLQAGTTQVKMRGMRVGVLRQLEIAKELDGVVAVIKLSPQTEAALNDKTRFWLVKPQLGFEGVSGLETLIQGNHIELSVAKGKGHPRQFNALERPPLLDASAPGLHLKLLTRDAEGLSPGAPIYYRQVQVGAIQSVAILDQGQQIAARIHIEQAYASLVNRSSRFWNSSGLSVQSGLRGIKIDAAPLRALLIGGISFDNPEQQNAPLVKNGAEFPLYSDRNSALEEGIRIQIGFASAENLAVDAPLRYQGITIGRITAIKLDPNSHRVAVAALVNSPYSYLIRQGSSFWVVKPRLGLTSSENLETLLTGSYIQIKPGPGAPQSQFIGLEREPLLLDSGDGYSFILESPRLGSLKKGSPVYFRQLPIGRVAGFALAADASLVEIHISIDANYAPLVRENSRFWSVSGIDLDISLFGGTQISTESVESILAGGIALATPDTTPLAPQAALNRHFHLYDKAKNEWKQWSPKIPIRTP